MARYNSIYENMWYSRYAMTTFYNYELFNLTWIIRVFAPFKYVCKKYTNDDSNGLHFILLFVPTFHIVFMDETLSFKF